MSIFYTKYFYNLLIPYTKLTLCFNELLLFIVLYFITTLPLYIMAKKANLKNPYYMFIPILNTYKLFNLANFEIKYFIIYLFIVMIPFLNLISIILLCIVLIRVYKNFGLNNLLCLLGIISPLIIFLYIALSNNVIFVGKINNNYLND